MPRPYLRWLLFGTCLLTFTAVMVWISHRTLDLEEQRQRNAEEAVVQERVRLALWRMDSLASAVLIRENARPTSHYQPFYAPEDIYSKDNQAIAKGETLMASPLLGNRPDLVKLHFEWADNASAISSPQVPSGNQRQMATNWYAIQPQLAEGSKQLTVLSQLLQRHPELRVTAGPAPKKIEAAEFDNQAPQIQTADGARLNQTALNTQENVLRSQVLKSAIANERNEAFKVAPRKLETPVPAAKAYADKDAIPPAPGAAPAPSPSQSSGAWSPADINRGSTASREPSAGAKPPLPSLAGDLRPIWIEDELLLVRSASVDGHERLQGVWLDWPQMRTRMLEAIQDLLPDAKLIPAPANALTESATALVTLPVKLMPGAVTQYYRASGSLLKPALVLAWFCLIAAAIAVAFVLHRTLVLSERRGAFVSAVTHELRTPLTTFRLYSEMLADDMVPEPAQRQSYLRTLCDESTRLMHLVENVLAYSRIERGRTAARVERVGIGELIERILPRLRQRADQVSLTLQCEITPEAAAVPVQVDAMAVEQILFNLTDNACKYAAPDSDPLELRMKIVPQANHVLIETRDFGPGLSREARKKLFRPFGKSAAEAAHSAPGVGLGLALSRRLARELGGDLTHATPEGRGSLFCLTLPRA